MELGRGASPSEARYQARPTAPAAALQIELAVDGLYELDFEQTLSMGRGALESARALSDGALIAAAAILYFLR